MILIADRRAIHVPGTIPQLEDKNVDREQLDPGSYYLTGRHGNAYGNEIPTQLGDPNSATDRAQILAPRPSSAITSIAPHAILWWAMETAVIVQRGYKRPPSFHVQRLRNAPIGWFYDVISNGFGAMPDYAAQVQPVDRWAIAVYIRTALQLSQNAADADVALEQIAIN